MSSSRLALLFLILTACSPGAPGPTFLLDGRSFEVLNGQDTLNITDEGVSGWGSIIFRQKLSSGFADINLEVSIPEKNSVIGIHAFAGSTLIGGIDFIVSRNQDVGNHECLSLAVLKGIEKPQAVKIGKKMESEWGPCSIFASDDGTTPEEKALKIDARKRPFPMIVRFLNHASPPEVLAWRVGGNLLNRALFFNSAVINTKDVKWPDDAKGLGQFWGVTLQNATISRVQVSE